MSTITQPRWATLSIAGAFLAGLAFVGATSAASPKLASNGGQSSPDAVIANVQSATSQDADPGALLALTGTSAGGAQASSDSVSVNVPSTGSGAVVLNSTTDDSAALKVGLPAESSSGMVLNTSSTGAVFQSTTSPAIAVQAYDDGAQISTVIPGSSSPTRYNYPVTVPAGGTVQLNDDGTVAVLASDGTPAGYIDTPWAVDATGRSVPTHFEVSGTTVTQVVDHPTTPDVQYPVVADPFLFKSLIDWARWEWIPRNGSIGAGWTLDVKPTHWQRRFNILTTPPVPAFAIAEFGWRELKKKYGSKGLDTNMSSMRNQYICHALIVSARAPHKSTWNLDEWRKHEGFAHTVKDYCNPGRGGPAVYR